MSVEVNEVIVLVIGALGFIPVIMGYVHNKGLKWMVISYTFLFIGLISTVIEGFFLNSFFNALEHFGGIFLAGLLFLFTTRYNNRKMDGVLESTKRKVGSK